MNQHFAVRGDMARKEIIATVSSQGQVTIPAAVRRHLGIKKSEHIAFVVDTEVTGSVQVVAPRYPDIDSIRGAAGSLAKPLSWQDMQQIAHEDHLAAHYSQHHE